MASVVLPIISEFNAKGIEAAKKEFESLKTVGSKAQFALKKAALPAIAALGALGAAAVPAVTAASDLNETISKTNVIFKDASKEVLDFSKNTAKTLGISQQAALDAAATFGTFGKAAGLTGKELSTFSTDFTGLAADLASFNNTTPEEAINAIGAALRGESEPLRAYGVLLNDATLKEAALKLGIYDGVGALTAQQKVLAAQKVIYEQTTDAQGDFARTSDGLANQQRILAASIEDLKAKLGQALLPVVQAAIPLFASFANFIANNSKLVLILAGIIAGLAAVIVTLNFALKAYKAIQTIATAATWAFNLAISANPLGLLVIALAAVAAALVYLELKFGFITKAVHILFDAVKSLLGPLGKVVELAGKVGSIIGGVAGGVGNFLGGIPGLAEGGIVNKPTLAMIGEGNGPEAVIPLDRLGNMGGGNVTVNVNGGLSTSAEIGQAVVNALRAYSRSAGPLALNIA